MSPELIAALEKALPPGLPSTDADLAAGWQAILHDQEAEAQ